MTYEFPDHPLQLKLRLFCELCGNIVHQPLIRGDPGDLDLIQCCGKDMLIAGEPKRDHFGLKKAGCLVDPISEYYRHNVPSRKFTDKIV